MIWTGFSFQDERLCPTCWQPQCPGSAPGVGRPKPGSHPTRVERGQGDDRGYHEVALHPEDAREILHAGGLVVNGRWRPVRFVHNEAFVTQVSLRPLHINGEDFLGTLDYRDSLRDDSATSSERSTACRSTRSSGRP